ncbi:MAG TPA: dienelactone hydrolase family protein [Lentimicrobium sp.]|nr:dienelactone hydrolase family protein [Lentimicrobium sp.]
MKNSILNRMFILLLITTPYFLTSCGENRTNNTNSKDNEQTLNEPDTTSQIVSEKVTYQDGGQTLVGYLCYDKSVTEKRPGVIVVPEWWGNNDYPQMRAKMLAELGYVALSADMYGNGKVVDNPKDAQENAGKFYSDPTKMKSRMMAAYNFLDKNDKVRSGDIAAIGYCFGGSVCLNSASMGVPVDAVASFHGGLEGFKASPNMKNVHTLVCNGKADQSVTKEQIENFKKEMKDADAPFDFKEYDNATHAFTNPASTENGKKFNMPIAYNKEADEESWTDMVDFFEKHFPLKR